MGLHKLKPHEKNARKSAPVFWGPIVGADQLADFAPLIAVQLGFLPPALGGAERIFIQLRTRFTPGI
jgi:hypothetical protein